MTDIYTERTVIQSDSVADPGADPFTTCNFYADPDPAWHFNAAQNFEKVLIGLYSIYFGLSSVNWCGFGSGSSLSLWCGSGFGSYLSIWCGSGSVPQHCKERSVIQRKSSWIQGKEQEFRKGTNNEYGEDPGRNIVPYRYLSETKRKTGWKWDAVQRTGG